jgi:tRNA A37 N6-isopentenylltransferase MiaA
VNEELVSANEELSESEAELRSALECAERDRLAAREEARVAEEARKKLAEEVKALGGGKLVAERVIEQVRS